jgi:hypothetical protein
MDASPMSQMLATPPPVAQDPPPPGPGRRRLRGVAVALGLSWLVPVLADLARLDALLPLVILVGTASLIRGGRTLLDRLMLALGLLGGAATLAGLLFTVWPWGLSPVVVAGTAGTVLVLIATALRRRPALPRPTLTDGLTAFVAAVVAGLLVHPYLGRGTGGRLDIAMAGEDSVRHFMLFDTIRKLGGYVWLQPGAADRAGTLSGGMTYYPQGSHLTYALLDNFLRSSTSPGKALTGFADMIGFEVAGFTVLTLAVLWAAQWIGGPLVRTGLRPVVLVAFLTPMLVYTSLLHIYTAGYMSQTYGLVLLVLLVAVLVRPLASRPTQIALVAALLTGIGFAYYLYLPAAGLAAVLWLVMRRRWLRGTPWWVLAAGALSVATATIPIAIGVLYDNQTRALSDLTSTHASRDLLLALALTVAAGIAARRTLRQPVWRRYVAVLCGVSVLFIGLAANDVLHHRHITYYPEKSLVAVELVLLLGVGVVARLAPRPVRGARFSGTGWRRLTAPIATALPALLVTGAMLAGFGVVGDTPFQPGPKGKGTWARSWWRGSVATRPNGQIVARILAEVPRPAGGLTIVMGEPYQSYQDSLFLSALDRRAGDPRLAEWVYSLPSPLLNYDPDELEQFMLRQQDKPPVTIVAVTPERLRFVQGVLERHPSLPVKLVDLTGLQR